jgi:hypothetical protein
VATPPGPPTPPSPDLPPPGAPPPTGWSLTVPPPTTPLPPRRTPIYIGIAVAVVVVVVILVLALLGILPFFKSAGPNGSFADSRGPAQSTANGQPGGPWNLVLAAGIAPRSTTNLSNLSTPLTNPSPNCTISKGSGVPPTKLEGKGNVSQGLASGWVFLFRGAAGGLLVVTDFSGSYQVEGTASGPGCASALGSYVAIPAGVVDSTTAATAADHAGGYAFLQAHPSANGTMGIVGGFSFVGFSVGAVWGIIYSTCPLVSTVQVSDPTFTAIVNATSGSVVQSTVGTMTCSVISTAGTTPLGTDLAVGTPTETSVGGHYWYNFTIQSAGGGLTWGNTAFQVQTAAGAIVVLPSSTTLKILSLTGSVVASYSFAAGSWLTGGSLGVTSQQQISISTPAPTSLSGDKLVIIGSGSFTGQLLVTIP